MSSTDDQGGLAAAGTKGLRRGSDAPSTTLRRVFEKLTHMTDQLREIEDWFDARNRALRVAPRRKLTSLEDVDRVAREESARE